jgi:serine phosphatase RsbU (regulator of sigma subunit)
MTPRESLETARPVLTDEASRREALERVALLDTPAEDAFDRLTRLATRTLRAPIALVSLVTEGGQFFKSCVGLPEPWATQRGTPLTHSFCRHVVASREPLIVTDARTDGRLEDHPAIRDLDVIAYAGLPLTTSDGHVLGSFCVIDHEPREWTAQELSVLADLTDAALEVIELRAGVLQADRASREREEARGRLAAAEGAARAERVRLLELSERLQRALLPAPSVAAAAVVSEYRPGQRELLLGGDFLDVLERPSGELDLIVGDVSGHGPEAAALAVGVRVAWSALARRGEALETLVGELDEVTRRERHDRTLFVTALVARVCPVRRTLRLVTAGHPPPLLLDGDAREALLPTGLPLGVVESATWTGAEVALAPGGALLAYTDGLVEGYARPGGGERFGVERLIALAAAGPVDAGLPARLIDAATVAHGAPLPDDVAVLLVRP